MLDCICVLRKELQFLEVRELHWHHSYREVTLSVIYRPQITESSTLKATQARHPLQELLVEHYIPNDVVLDSSDSIKIVTGHNGSGEKDGRRVLRSSLTTLYWTGKSVYLKMVGLLQYMAQIGSFVPAEKGNERIRLDLVTCDTF